MTEVKRKQGRKTLYTTPDREVAFAIEVGVGVGVHELDQ